MFRRFIHDLKNYFAFTAWQRNGVLVILLLIIAALLAPKIYSQFFYQEKTFDTSAFQKDIDEFMLSVAAADSAADEIVYSGPESVWRKQIEEKENENLKNAVLFPFNPNQLPDSLWRKLGVKESVIKTIKNFESKGGRFYRKEDLKKIYGLSEADYLRLEPYILIPKAEIVYEKPVDVIKQIEINSADSVQFVELKGIGPVLASRILKFRNKLGGFYSVDQLKDVYGIKPETFDMIKDQLIIDEANLKKIDLNTVTVEELKVHPYIGNGIATAIINYRTQHGNFKSIDDLKNIKAIDDSSFEKMKHYLTVVE